MRQRETFQLGNVRYADFTQIILDEKGGESMKPSIKFFKLLALSFMIMNLGSLPGLAQTTQKSGDVSAGDNIIYRDDFMGKSLRPEWEIRAKDPNRWSLIDNEYLLLVTYGPSPKNIMVYTGELPENYEIMVKYQSTPELGGQAVGLSFMGDMKNYLDVYYWKNPSHGLKEVNFGKKLMGEYSEYNIQRIQISSGNAIFLKLSKLGIEYTGYYSLDGASWSKVGTHIFLNLKGKPEFYVYNDKSGMPESGVRIDYFEIKKID
jgi:hypothetical protein